MKKFNFWLLIATALIASAAVIGCSKDDGGDENGNGNGNGNENTEISVPASVVLPVGTGSVTFALEAPAGELWSLSVSGKPNTNWVEVTPKNGEGPATITVTVNSFNIARDARTATVTVGGKSATLSQPPYITGFSACIHPNQTDNPGMYLMLASTNFITGSTYGFANSPDDAGDYFQYGAHRGYTKDEAWGVEEDPDLSWKWFHKYDVSGFPPLSTMAGDGTQGVINLCSGEEVGRFWGHLDNPSPAASGYPEEFDETPYQWRAKDEVGNKIAGMFIGENAKEATISDLKGCVFFPAAGYRKDAANGALTDLGVKGYYLYWDWNDGQDWAPNGVFVVSAAGMELWGEGDIEYEDNWDPRNGASIRVSFSKDAINL
jgi:hypothetical protein